MRIPYHPLTHQQLNQPGNDEGLAEEEKQELTDMSVLLFFRVIRLIAGCFAFMSFFCVTLLIFG
ncbi:TPA: hypothetical protein N2E47_002629 [Salmonella enterica]|nr:hypothetical protein [Salmonella enterica]